MYLQFVAPNLVLESFAMKESDLNKADYSSSGRRIK